MEDEVVHTSTNILCGYILACGQHVGADMDLVGPGVDTREKSGPHSGPSQIVSGPPPVQSEALSWWLRTLPMIRGAPQLQKQKVMVSFFWKKLTKMIQNNERSRRKWKSLTFHYASLRFLLRDGKSIGNESNITFASRNKNITSATQTDLSYALRCRVRGHLAA